MTRIFLRFYLGVIAILVLAWFVQAYVFRRSAVEKNIAVVEQALAGGARLARDEIVAGGKAQAAETVQQLQTQFDFPIQIVAKDTRPLSETMSQRLERGEVVLLGDRLEVAFPESEYLLELGPLPKFSGPTQADYTIGLGTVFALTAIAIAILLRPIANQLRSVERTALAIAGGDLSARIDSQLWKRSVPLADAFNTMADRVEKVLLSQKELLQAVSHELRTPLSRVQFATELLRSAEDQQQRDLRIDAIDEATDQLNDLVGELLKYVRLDAETETAEHESIVVDQLIEESINDLAPLYQGVDFRFSASSPPLVLDTFRPGLLRAMNNLVSNAGKYCRSTVLVSASQQQASITITVEDDGVGIAPLDREAVFEPFKRLSSSSQPGAGLGLALVRRICRRLGGDVTISTSHLGGAKFTVTLPKKFESPKLLPT